MKIAFMMNSESESEGSEFNISQLEDDSPNYQMTTFIQNLVNHMTMTRNNVKLFSCKVEKIF